MAQKQTRRTATKRTTTRGGRGGGNQQQGGYSIPKVEARGLITGWMKQDKLLNNVIAGHQNLFKTLQPIAKLHGLELTNESGSGQKTKTTRAKRTTTARTGRGRSQQELQAASA